MTQFVDFVALGWVEQSLRGEIEAARKCLYHFQREPDKTAHLQEAERNIHSATSALKLCTLEPAALLSQEIEAVLAMLHRGEIRGDEQKQAMTELVAAIEALPAYLASVRSLREITPGSIANVVNDLRQFGQRAPLPESMFFNPPMPEGAGITPNVEPRGSDELVAFAERAMRIAHKYSQQAIRRDKEALARLHAMADHACEQLAGTSMEAYFRCYSALLQAMSQTRLRADEVIVEILKYAFSFLRNLSMDGQAALQQANPEPFIKKTLYYLAALESPSPQQQSLLDAWGIEDLESYTQGSDNRMIQEDDLLDALRQTLDQLLEIMRFLGNKEERISAGNTTLREKIVPSLLQVSMQLHVIGLSQLASAINEQYKILASYAQRSEPTSQSDLVDFGAVLSSVKDAMQYKLEHGLAAEGDAASLELERAVSAQVVHLLQDMKGCIHKQLARQDLQTLIEAGAGQLQLTVGGLRPMYRAAKLVAPAELLESIYDWEEEGFPDPASTLAIAQALLGSFAEEDYVTTANQNLEQILSVLSMLEERNEECKVLSLCSEFLGRIREMGGLLRDQSLQCFTESIAALEQYLDCRMEDPHGAQDEHVQRALERALQLQDLLDQRAKLENPDSNVVEFLSSGKRQNTPAAAQTSLDLEAPAPEAQAPAASTEPPPQEVSHSIDAGNHSDALPWREALDLWSQYTIDRQPEPVGQGPDAEIDAELRECFVEECEEYLDKLAAASTRLRETPEDKDLIASIRVVFHTMKGSARTIGLMAFGDFMHDMERVFNALRDGMIHGSEQTAEFVSAVAEKMPQYPRLITARIPLAADDFQVPGLIADAIANDTLGDTSLIPVPQSMEAVLVIEEEVEEPAESSEAIVSEYHADIWIDSSADTIVEQCLAELGQQKYDVSADVLAWAGELLGSAIPCLVDLRDGGFLDLGVANVGYFLDIAHLEHLASGAVYGLVEDEHGNQQKITIQEAHTEALAEYVAAIKAHQHRLDAHRDLESLLLDTLQLEDTESLKEANTEHQEEIPDNVVAFRSQEQLEADTETEQIQEIDEELLELFIETLDEYSESIDVSLSELNNGQAEGLRGLKNTLHTVKGAANSIGLAQLGSLVHQLESRLEDIGIDTEVGSAEFLGAVEILAAEFTEATRFVRRNKSDWEETESASETQSTATDDNHNSAQVESEPAESGERRTDTLRVETQRVDRLLDMGLEVSMSNVRARQSLDAAAQGRTEVQSLARRVLALVDQLSLQLDTEIQARTEAMPEGEQFDPLEMDRMTEKQGLAAILREAAYDLQEESRDMGMHLDNASREASSINRLTQSSQSDLRMLRLVNFSKLGPGFRRLVHQLSRQLGKQVEFDFSCGEGGLDVTVFEQIRTALEHMLRNAIDHGISAPQQRSAEGKAETGKVQLTIKRQGSEFAIQLLDDGRGLDPQVLREKAIEQGILGAGEELGDEEALRLIFHSGLSTAERLTDVSGRGVGMDAVYQAITQVGGSINIQSKAGFYTQFDLRVPASIMVNEALLATVGDEQIAIPLTSLKGSEFHRREDIFREAHNAKGRLSFRGEKYEVRYLGVVRGTQPLPTTADAMPDFVPVLYAQQGRRRVAFFADALDTAEDMVIRSLGAQYTGVPGIAGGAVKPDGQPVLALDLNEFIGQVDHADKQATGQNTEEGQSTLILCVDDSVMMRRTYEKRLQSLGYTVVTAVDGEDALDYLSQAAQQPDFIFTDLEMPNMNGFDFIANLRRAPTLAHIPTVVVSSRDGDKHRAEADRVGANGFMAKGANSAEAMQALIEQHIGNQPAALVS